MLARGDWLSVLAPEDEAVPDLEEMGARFIPLVMDNKGINPARDAALA